jgi:hypothetical protein
MRRNYNTQSLSVRHYQHFAWFTLGLAILAGLGGETFGGQGGAAVARSIDGPPTLNPTGLAQRSSSFDLAAESDDLDAPASDVTAPAPDMALLTSGEKGKAVVNPHAGPKPGQIGQLVAASRERSGSTDQGDEASLAL